MEVEEVMDDEKKAKLCKSDPFSNIDWRYEFSAPKYYDFTYEEKETDVHAAERWFDSAVPYENSPHVAKTKSISELWSTAMSNKAGVNFEAMQILAHVSPKPDGRFAAKVGKEDTRKEFEDIPRESRDCNEATNSQDGFAFVAPVKICQDEPYTPEGRIITGVNDKYPPRTPPTALAALAISPGSLPAKRLYSDAWNEPPLPDQGTQAKSKDILAVSSCGRWNVSAKKDGLTQAQKKQKLEGGRLQQLLFMKDRLPRPKDPPTLTIPQEFCFRTETRAQIHQDCAKNTIKSSPFVSMAERIRRFHMKNRKEVHVQSGNSSSQAEVHPPEKPKLKLTAPKTPEFETSQRSRPPRVKSAAELEEEMLANIPKFKARPLPKKILEVPALPTFTKSTPHIPKFQEFHLHTMDRAQYHANTSASSSAESVPTSNDVLKLMRILTKPHPPQLETTNRARPSTFKNREELELEELARLPKFKARPLNKMIFQNKGDLGVPLIQKLDVTKPKEFHFKTEKRAQARGPPSLADQLLKLSLNKPTKEDPPLRPTKPEPFHLATDDRGLAREMWVIHQRVQEQQAEAQARIPKAKPLPNTTKHPEIPPKPVSKECTKPDPFYLESLVRHESKQEEMVEEQAQAEQLKAALREFRALPNPSNGPILLPQRRQKPLTEIKVFNLLVDRRATEREEFEKKVAEKQNQFKRYRKEFEAARKAEEERFIKAMRREMVPTTRPMPMFPRPAHALRSTKEPTQPVTPQVLKKISWRERQQSIAKSGTRSHLR